MCMRPVWLQVDAGDAVREAAAAPAVKLLWAGVAAECKLSRALLGRSSNTTGALASYQVSSQVGLACFHKYGMNATVLVSQAAQLLAMVSSSLSHIIHCLPDLLQLHIT